MARRMPADELLLETVHRPDREREVYRRPVVLLLQRGDRFGH
jgi:hypothetical protein